MDVPVKWANRVELLKMLPKNSVGIELGVCWGTYSLKMVEIIQPSKLHLVDAWEVETAKSRVEEITDPQSKFDLKLRKVQQRFGTNPKVKIHVGLTGVVVKEFADSYFDWIYVDADHSFEGATADFNDYWPKLKSDGYLMAHDYSKQFDVMNVVHAFAKRPDVEIVGQTGDNPATCILQKVEDK